MLEYDLPEDWEFMPHVERLEWHVDRVEKEEPVFTMLAEIGIMTCFEPDEIRLRLALVQAQRRRVESALVMAEDQEFQGFWDSLRMILKDVQEDIAERARMLSLQMRRKGFTATCGETAKLLALRICVDEKLDEAETIEGEIIRLCDKHGADPSPYLLVDNVRDSK